MEMNEEKKRKRTYPWKGFLIFVGLYLFALGTYYPVLQAQAEIYLGLVGEAISYTANQFAGLAMVQPLLLGIVAIYGGHRFAQKVGLRSLINERVEKSESPQIERKTYGLSESVPFIVLFAVGLALLNIGFDFLFQNWLPNGLQVTAAHTNIWQGLSSVFYGGLAQEILLRWGVMTTLIYVISSKGKELSPMTYIVGFVFTAVLYAFSQAGTLTGAGDYTAILWTRHLLLNALDGILYGWLYYKFHFEAAALSHMLTNLFVILGTFLVAAIAG